jgi:eukaryotic-like serine/threonine-protein kinase
MGLRPAWGPMASVEEVRHHLQQRLRLFAVLMFWIFWILVAFVFAMYEIYPDIRPPRVDLALGFAIAALLVGATIWAVALRRGATALPALHAIDGIYLAMVGMAHGCSIYLQSEILSAVHTAFYFQTLIVFARTLIVPSTARRTAVVSLVSFVPVLVGGVAVAVLHPERIDLPAPAFCVGAMTFMSCAVLVATTGSWVIYGLRRQVDAARQLGQYTLSEKIGEGGMGAVYRAHHAMLRRPTAIKLIRPERLDGASLARFEREVHHMSGLTHANTVAVFDYGRSPDGVFYYAMEYLDGVTLETLVRDDGPQPAPRVVHILQQICGALAEAHALDLTHRDIKPANVILCQRGGVPDVAKVVDFGLVKEISRDRGETARTTITGTPAYISPEGVTDPDRVGPRSDLYSLGAVGYYLLTGRRVFDGKTAVEICIQHVQQAPAPPSTHADVPAELDALILACLAKDPDARPASAHALRQALHRVAVDAAWDEAAATEWWREFAARGAARTTTTSTSSATVTVDMLSRTSTG